MDQFVIVKLKDTKLHSRGNLNASASTIHFALTGMFRV